MTGLQAQTDTYVNRMSSELARVQGSVELHDMADALDAAMALQRLSTDLLVELRDAPL